MRPRSSSCSISGLDHYFTGQYDQAINVWTRALFLDRNHARARAYIERARSALAERQRESEELLHNGVAAFDRGESSEARRLLEAAISQGAPPDEALAILDRLNRLDQSARQAETDAARRRARAVPLPQVTVETSRGAWVTLGVLLIVILAAAAFGAGAFRSDWRMLLERPPAPTVNPIGRAASDETLIPRRGDTALARARVLVTNGRLRDALVVLDLVRPTDPQKARRRPAPRGYSETVDRVGFALAPTAGRPRRWSRTMKCPKCGYLGFKHVERCPNCGYDFSLSSSPALLDLSIRPSSLNTPRPLADLALVDSGLSLSSPEPKHGTTPEIGSVQIVTAPAPTPELPLFGSPGGDDVPLITRPSPPRTPLAVRRATPEVPRLRADPRTSPLDFVPSDLDSRLSAPLATPPARRAAALPDRGPQPAAQLDAPAAVSARIFAALIDVVLLLAIDFAVVYLTDADRRCHVR